MEREGKNYKKLNISRTKRAFFIKQKTIFKISRRVKKKWTQALKIVYNIVKNINIPNFSFEFTPLESTAGGTLLYTADHLAYQKQNDLKQKRIWTW